ncbi:MAG: peptidoglycan-binding domain-containing protein [Cyanobacteria bacterium J06656_5]
MFELSVDQLKSIWAANQFAIPDDQWIFFGLRGCLPASDASQSFADKHVLVSANVDYHHSRCTIGQLKPDGTFALFPGSTVPHINNISKARKNDGAGANQLMTGYHPEYRKGQHKAGQATGHRAFRQENKIPILRSADDLDYDTDDRVEYATPYDNIHAAWCMSTDSDYFASAGCQVIVGFPSTPSRDNKPNAGPWRSFVENAYGIDQKRFGYILLNGRDAISVAAGKRPSVRLRFGSQGPLVGNLQRALATKGFYEDAIDEDFGRYTLFAVLDFQKAVFGPQADDGIVGPITAAELGMHLPEHAGEKEAPSVPVAAPAITISPKKVPKTNPLGLWMPSPDAGAFTLPVNHYAQIDNSGGEGPRECFMTSCTMLADYITNGRLRRERKEKGFDEPEDAYFKYMDGDTTISSVHEKALKKMGIDAYFSDRASIKDVESALYCGIPVPIGTQYKNSGHWVVVNGRGPKGWDILCPNGIRDGKSSNWIQRFQNESQAKQDSFSWRLLEAVFTDLGPEKGYAIFVTAVNDVATGVKKGM